MSKYPYISQVDQRDCGVAALSMILKAYGSSYSLASLRELAQTSREGTSALGLIQAANQLGLETQAIRADLSLFDEPKLVYPFIVHVVKDGSLQHYYTIFGQKNGELIVGDPDPSRKIFKISRDNFDKEWTGVTLFFEPGKEYTAHREKVPGLLSFIPTLVEKKGWIISIVILSFLVTLINIVGSYYLQSLLDYLIPARSESLLTLISVGLCLAYGLQQLFTFAKEYILQKLGNHLSAQVILPYIRHVLSLPMSFFSSRRTGEITSRFSDASTIIDALASTILSIFLDVTITLTLSIALLVQNTFLFSLTLAVIPFYILVIFAFYKIFDKENYQVMEANSQVNTAIIDDLRGIETLKSLRVEKRRYQEIENKFHTYLDKSLRKARWQLTQEGLKTTIQLVANVVILWAGAYLVMQRQLSVGQLITFNMLLSYFTNPLLNIINLQTKLQQAKVANNRLQEVYIVAKEKTSDLSNFTFEQIKLDNISHRFSYQQETLHGIDLQIKPGDKLALMGKSGSGKTTLAKILAGYDSVSNGAILLNGKEVGKPELRQLVTYIPQQSYVFTGTILDNLLLGQESVPDEKRIIEVCVQADILDDIQQMPLGFQTQVSEDGGLSGGQKQRLAIARALLTDQPILIFDEATSGLDSETESKVMANLISLDRTILFIAHRNSIRTYVNKVIAVDDRHQKVETNNHLFMSLI